MAELLAFYDDFGRGMDGMQLPYECRCFKAVVVEPAEPDDDEDADGGPGPATTADDPSRPATAPTPTCC